MSNPKYKNVGDPVTCVIEEMAELIHILCKVNRFGWDNFHPDDPKKTPNWALVWGEIEDVRERLGDLKMLVKNQEKRYNSK